MKKDNLQNLTENDNINITKDTDANERVNTTHKDEAQALAKQTLREFLKSILVGIFPVLLDLLLSTLVFYLFFAKDAGFTFNQLLFSKNLNIPHKITVFGTAVGYGTAAVLAYLLAVFFVFDNKKQGRTVKGIVIFICVEGFAYGFNILLGWLFNLFIPSSFAFILRICVSYVIVFSLRKFLIFMPKKEQKNT